MVFGVGIIEKSYWWNSDYNDQHFHVVMDRKPRHGGILWWLCQTRGWRRGCRRLENCGAKNVPPPHKFPSIDTQSKYLEHRKGTHIEEKWRVYVASNEQLQSLREHSTFALWGSHRCTCQDERDDKPHCRWGDSFADAREFFHIKRHSINLAVKEGKFPRHKKEGIVLLCKRLVINILATLSFPKKNYRE